MVIDDMLGEISHAENLHSKLYAKVAIAHPVHLLLFLNDDIIGVLDIT